MSVTVMESNCDKTKGAAISMDGCASCVKKCEWGSRIIAVYKNKRDNTAVLQSKKDFFTVEIHDQAKCISIEMFYTKQEAIASLAAGGFADETGKKPKKEQGKKKEVLPKETKTQQKVQKPVRDKKGRFIPAGKDTKKGVAA